MGGGEGEGRITVKRLVVVPLTSNVQDSVVYEYSSS